MSVAQVTSPAVPTAEAVFHHLLMATDFSEASRRALAGAMTIAAQNHAHLSVVHVMHTDWRYEILDNPPEIDLERIDVQRRLESATQEIASGLASDCIIIRHGPVPQKVIALAEEAGTDLIVIGTRGRAGLTKLALGSVAEELLRIAPCPVITFGPKAKVAAIAPQGPAFPSILFATDFGAGSANALPYVRAMAAAPSTHIALLHMMAPMSVSSSLSAYAPASAAAEEFQEWQGASRGRSVQRLRKWWLGDAKLAREPDYVVGMDFLPEGVLTAAEQRHCDLIVMGAHHAAPRLAAHIPWSAVHEVIRQASCPVMTCVGE